MWCSYLPEAVAALDAIAEPTIAMIEAAEDAGVACKTARVCWSVMHKAAKTGPT
jgi:hypothetical protein